MFLVVICFGIERECAFNIYLRHTGRLHILTCVNCGSADDQAVCDGCIFFFFREIWPAQ
jgi:hypothetical protein